MSSGTLALNAVFNSANGGNHFGQFKKSGPGMLILDQPMFASASPWDALDQGTLVLNSGVDNTVFFGINSLGQTLLSVANNMIVDGGMLDLNGHNQVFANLNSTNVLPGCGGTITTSVGSATLNAGAGTFAGSLVNSGTTTLSLSAYNGLTLTNSQGYSGSTALAAAP